MRVENEGMGATFHALAGCRRAWIYDQLISQGSTLLLAHS